MRNNLSGIQQEQLEKVTNEVATAVTAAAMSIYANDGKGASIPDSGGLLDSFWAEVEEALGSVIDEAGAIVAGKIDVYHTHYPDKFKYFDSHKDFMEAINADADELLRELMANALSSAFAKAIK